MWKRCVTLRGRYGVSTHEHDFHHCLDSIWIHCQRRPGPLQSSFLVRGTTPNGGVDGLASRAAHVMGVAIPNVLQPGAFVWFEKTQGPLVKGAWMVADKAVDCTRAFLMMWWSSRRVVCRGSLEPSLRVNDIS
ncbi:uncharacterized protein TNCV_135011 [Trichonephila clavipes]|nr:uncharacterized protein TNCV_135011 [Trichonephila clavipes]